MTHVLVTFLVSFTSVFLLGFQSRAVNHDNYWMAACNSILIGMVQWQVWKLADHNRESFLLSLVFAAGGAAGITSSMYVHKKLLQKWNKPKQ